MPRLVWGQYGTRYYENGLDRGVLYLASDPGVPWNGLISITEAPDGGDAKPYYLDGFKYLNVSLSEEYAATINAFGYPKEFAPCDGQANIQNGLIATQQPRRPFSLTYRTKMGNDVDGLDFSYKIHIVYNGLAAPSQRSNQSIGGNSGDPATFSWNITTKPPSITGYKPTAHFVIDAQTTDPEILSDIEDILYGTEADLSRLPTPDELIAIFTP